MCFFSLFGCGRCKTTEWNSRPTVPLELPTEQERRPPLEPAKLKYHAEVNAVSPPLTQGTKDYVSNYDSNTSSPPRSKSTQGSDDRGEPKRWQPPVGYVSLAGRWSVVGSAGPWTSLAAIYGSRDRLGNTLLPQQGPPCLNCGDRSTLFCTKPGNLNNNAGRPYYLCDKDECGRHVRGKWVPGKWCTWADVKGVAQENVRCSCRIPSRRDAAGMLNQHPGRYFWTCAEGTCRFFRQEDEEDYQRRPGDHW